VIAFSTLCVSLIGLIDTDQALAVLNDAAVPLFLILGVFGGGVSFLLYIAGLNYTAASVAAVVAMVEPVTASLFGVLVLNQSLTELQITGMVLILLTVTALSIYSGSQRLPDDNI
jgi:drug/metabolite transporter (DMT)-like permease